MAPSRHQRPSVRAFRALLALYPAAFRDEYRRELTLAFVDRDRGARGAWDRLRLWFEALTGVIVEAPKEHARMLLQDVRYGWRVLRRHALVTTTIVVTLGVGIGLNTAMFSLVDAVVLRSLPLNAADELYTVNYGPRVITGPESARLSGPQLDRLERVTPPGVAIAAMSRGIARVHTRIGDATGTTPANLQLASSSYFSVLGAPPILGGPLPGDADPALGNRPVAVISHTFWQRSFSGDMSVIGRPLTINGSPFTIVGVGPQGFAGPWLEEPVDIWVPLTMQDAVKYSQDYTADGVDPNRAWIAQPNIWWLHVVVRSSEDKLAATRGAFNSALSAVEQRDDVGLVLDPFARGFSRLRRDFRLPLYALTAMAALVLLVACANVSSLLLARAVERQREIAIRMALGAGRGRLLHQLLAESVLLIFMAAVAAQLFATWAAQGLARMATATADTAPPLLAGIDIRMLAFTAGVAFLSVLIFGVIPARQATRLDVAYALTSARGTVGRLTRGPARALVILQVASSLVLVTATGLVVRSFQNLLHVDLGFDPDRLLSVTVDPRLSGIPPETYANLYEHTVTAASSVPGVESVSLAMCGVQAGCRSRESDLHIEGYQRQPNEQIFFVVNRVDPNYFSTIGMRVIAGRPFDRRDGTSGPKVAVVNRALATTYFSNGQAIGRRFGHDEPDTEIVGIVDDARLLSPSDPPVPTAFYPLSARNVAARALEVRTAGPPERVIPALRRQLTATVPELPIENIVTMSDRIERGRSRWRLILMMTTGFGVVALGLAGFGLFGVLSNAVVRRTPEFGVRIALGASRRLVIWSVVREAVWLVLIGLVLGLPVVFLGGRLISTLLFDVGPFDGLSVIAATLVLTTVGALCSALPALRASRVDPIVALRQE